MSSRVLLRYLIATVILVLVCAGAVAAFAAASSPEPGPAQATVTADYWGSYKAAGAELAVDREDRKPFVAGVSADSDRHPKSKGIRNELRFRIGASKNYFYHDAWREDAPPVFTQLEKICSLLNGAC
jgi:hypothetical protein